MPELRQTGIALEALCSDYYLLGSFIPEFFFIDIGTITQFHRDISLWDIDWIIFLLPLFTGIDEKPERPLEIRWRKQHEISLLDY